MVNNTLNSVEISKNLKEIQQLLKHSIVIQLFNAGASQNEICKNLSLSKTTVNAMLKGVKKENKTRIKKGKEK